MAQAGGDASALGRRFNLPDEVVAVIPTDPYDQLDLARKITSMAIASRVTNLEVETGNLRQKLYEKERVIEELADNVARLETACEDTESRLKIANEENMKLLKEKDSLISTVKKLGRDLNKLEAFKRQLMQSLNDENFPQAETVDIGTYDQSEPKASSQNGFEQAAQRSSMALHGPSQLSPAGSLKVNANVGPKGLSGSNSPRFGTSSPRTEGTLSPWFPSSYQSSATNSPPQGRPLQVRSPRIDGKEFYRQVRNRLSLEQFTAFLANVKELNAQRQTREETLRKAEGILGMDNRDLFVSFQALLTRSMH